jgi:hypothetical protein
MRVSRAAAGLQLQGVLMTVVGTLGSVPAFLVSGPPPLPARAILAVVLAAAQYGVFMRRKRNWYRERAEAASPAELSWSFETIVETRRRVVRRYGWVYAVMLLVVAAFGLVTGLPVAAGQAGFAAGMLTKARWLRSWEHAAGVVLWVVPDIAAVLTCVITLIRSMRRPRPSRRSRSHSTWPRCGPTRINQGERIGRGRCNRPADVRKWTVGATGIEPVTSAV